MNFQSFNNLLFIFDNLLFISCKSQKFNVPCEGQRNKPLLTINKSTIIMSNLFAAIEPTNIEFGAYLIASAIKKENELIKAAIDSTECLFEVEVLPRALRAINEESGEVFDIDLDLFCNFMLAFGDIQCEIAFDLWLKENVQDAELAQWVEAFMLAEDEKKEFRGQFGEYQYEVAYKYIKTNPVDKGAAPAPFPSSAPQFLEGEQGELEEGQEAARVPLFI